MKKFNLLVFIVLLFSSCGNNQTSHKPVFPSKVRTGNAIALSYAKGFSIEKKGHYKKITVFSPWKKGETYATYYLVTDSKVKTPENGVKIQIPVHKTACTSVTHLGFLDELGEIQTVKGFCKPQLAYNQSIRENGNKGKIVDLGDAFTINMEKTLALKPDVLFTSGYNQSNANLERIQRGNIPVVYNMEWMETTLLGRAEWIKFMAAFFDKESEADSIFARVEKSYNNFREAASKAKSRPEIMTGSNFHGTWYVPSGKSFMGKLFQDAGASYFYANDTTGGSLPLNLETVLKNFSNASFWLNCNYNSMDELLQADSKNSLFQAVKENHVYNFNKRMLPSTANDFWESAVAHPDSLLGDVIFILHPEILPHWKLVYSNHLSKE